MSLCVLRSFESPRSGELAALGFNDLTKRLDADLATRISFKRRGSSRTSRTGGLRATVTGSESSVPLSPE